MFPLLLRQLKPLKPSSCIRVEGLVTSSVNRYKEIRIKEDGNEIEVEGVPIQSDRKEHLVPLSVAPGVHAGPNCSSCPLCRLNLKGLVYSDVLILSQFVDSSGSVLHRSITGLCARSHAKVKKLIGQAQKARLLPRPKDHVPVGPWESLNTYFEYPQRKRDRPMHVVREEYWK